MASQQEPYYTPEQYLAFEREAEGRHEYLDGRIYAMTGGGPANSTMVLSMFTYLTSFVRFDFSLGAAASWLMLLMSMLMCLAFIAVIRRRDAT